jgi:hypothetical protein
MRVYEYTPFCNGRTRQLSVRRERVAEVGRWLDNYRKLKQAIEAICELNHELLRPEPRRIGFLRSTSLAAPTHLEMGHGIEREREALRRGMSLRPSPIRGGG